MAQELASVYVTEHKKLPTPEVINRGTYCDLSSPGNSCAIVYADANDRSMGGFVVAPARNLIYLAQTSLRSTLESFIASGVQVRPTGKYDCATAQDMVTFARYIRDWPAIQADGFRMGLHEFQALLQYSSLLHAQVLEKANVQGAIGQSLVFAVMPYHFIPPTMPDECGFSNPMTSTLEGDIVPLGSPRSSGAGGGGEGLPEGGVTPAGYETARDKNGSGMLKTIAILGGIGLGVWGLTKLAK